MSQWRSSNPSPDVKGLGWVVAVLLLFLLQPAWAQSAETLGTRLTLSDNVLNFRWEPKHPWAHELSANGVELLADYATARQGRVVEKLGVAHPLTAADDSISLRLPGTLQAVPLGNVCLSLQVVGGRRIPLRKPRAGDADTEHFGVPAWQAAVRDAARARLHQTTLQTLEAAVAAGSATVQANAVALQAKGWTNAASCTDVQPPKFVASAKPADVLPPDQHEAEARHICIRRSTQIREWLQNNRPADAVHALPPPEVDVNLIRWLHTQKGVDMQDLQMREAGLLEYRADWNRWQATVHDEIQRKVTPILGSSTDELTLQDVTAEVGREILSFAVVTSPVLDLTRHPPVQDVLGYVGGGMETYSRCVRDGQDELAAKQKAWNEQVQRAPMLEQISREQLRTQCGNAFNDLDRQRQQLASLQQQLDAERQRESSTLPSHALSASAQPAVLNQAACTVQ